MAFAGNTVACRVSHEALRNHADRMHISGTDAAVFETCRELIEEVASEAHDAEGPFDAQGRVLVTSEALARVTRSLRRRRVERRCENQRSRHVRNLSKVRGV
jgi:hypothetical protein